MPVVVFLLLTLPLSLLLYLTTLLNPHETSLSPLRCLAALLATTLISHYSVRRRSLTLSGGLAAWLVGLVLALCGLTFFCALLAMFISTSTATKYHQRRSGSTINSSAQDKMGRNWVQVFCNGLIATELGILYLIDCGPGERCISFSSQFAYNSSMWSLAILGALCTCAGDTLASELAPVLTYSTPRLLISGARVPCGTNGGVTLAGLFVSFVGGILVGVGWYLGLWASNPPSYFLTCTPQYPVILLCGFYGFIGSLIDSFLGSTVQYSGWDSATRKVTETPAKDVTHISGYPFLDNHSVNLLSICLTALVAPSLGLRFLPIS